MADNELLQQWLDKGNDDLRSAEYLSTMHHPTPDEIICYLCQQSSEKYLKGFLFLHDVEPPKIHNLLELMEKCEQINNNFSVLLPQLNVLTNYSSLPRYPNELGITDEHMKVAIKYAKIVQEYILKIIDEELKSDKNDTAKEKTVNS
jgi:HEPN domain-containing protein